MGGARAGARMGRWVGVRVVCARGPCAVAEIECDCICARARVRMRAYLCVSVCASVCACVRPFVDEYARVCVDLVAVAAVDVDADEEADHHLALPKETRRQARQRGRTGAQDQVQRPRHRDKVTRTRPCPSVSPV